MNEILFFLQTLIIIVFVLSASKLGSGALTAWVSLLAIAANLFVLKQISLFGFEVTASDAFAIGSLMGLNIIQEKFGKEEAKKATWICFFFMFFFAIIAKLHVLFEPSSHDTTQTAFETILSPSPRLFIASISVFFIMQQIDVLFFSFLKKRLPLASFALRSGIALVTSQLLDTILFSFTGLYGMVNSITDIIIVSFALKLIVLLCFTTIMKAVKT